MYGTDARDLINKKDRMIRKSIVIINDVIWPKSIADVAL